MSIADLSTEEVAAFQMLEEAFTAKLQMMLKGPTDMSSVNVTLIRAEDAETGKPVAVVTLFKPTIKEGEFAMLPIARLIEPEEVINPVLEHTDGAGSSTEEPTAETDNGCPQDENREPGDATGDPPVAEGS